jgi:hypothetical protein
VQAHYAKLELEDIVRGRILENRLELRAAEVQSSSTGPSLEYFPTSQSRTDKEQAAGVTAGSLGVTAHRITRAKIRSKYLKERLAAVSCFNAMQVRGSAEFRLDTVGTGAAQGPKWDPTTACRIGAYLLHSLVQCARFQPRSQEVEAAKTTYGRRDGERECGLAEDHGLQDRNVHSSFSRHSESARMQPSESEWEDYDRMEQDRLGCCEGSDDGRGDRFAASVSAVRLGLTDPGHRIRFGGGPYSSFGDMHGEWNDCKDQDQLLQGWEPAFLHRRVTVRQGRDQFKTTNYLQSHPLLLDILVAGDLGTLRHRLNPEEMPMLVPPIAWAKHLACRPNADEARRQHNKALYFSFAPSVLIYYVLPSPGFTMPPAPR